MTVPEVTLRAAARLLLAMTVSAMASCSCHAVAISLRFDPAEHPEIHADVSLGQDGFYDPEFNSADVVLALRGVGFNGEAGILLTSMITGVGSDDASEPLTISNQGLGVRTSNGTGVNFGESIEFSFNQAVSISAFSLSPHADGGDYFYKAGDALQVDLQAPAGGLPQTISIPSMLLPAGEKFVVGTEDLHFQLSDLVLEFDGPVSVPTVINIPPDPAPASIGANTQLNLLNGSLGAGFIAGDGSEVNIQGGVVQPGFRALVGSMVSVTGGRIDSNFTTRGVTNVSGGIVGDLFFATTGSVVTISGGSVGSVFSALEGSEVFITGGAIGGGARTIGGSITVSGGTIGRGFSNSRGGDISLVGGEFRIDGVPIEGLTTVGDSMVLNAPPGAVLTGVFADGTPFRFSARDEDVLSSPLLQLADLPAVNDTTIVVPGEAPRGLRDGQTLVVGPGGAVGDNFPAAFGSRVKVTGGRVGDRLEVWGGSLYVSNGYVGSNFYADLGSVVSISGGTIDRNGRLFGSSVLRVTGGTVGRFFDIFSGSRIAVMGGTVGEGLTVFDGGFASIAGGEVGEEFVAESGGTIEISGGRIGGFFGVRNGGVARVSGGEFSGSFSIAPGGEVYLTGTEFDLAGIDLTGSLTPGEPLLVDARDVVLSGRLADGTPFSFDLNSQWQYGSDWFAPDAVLRITLAPEPSAGLLASLALATALARKRGAGSEGGRQRVTE